jgi:hypothetical protein
MGFVIDAILKIEFAGRNDSRSIPERDRNKIGLLTAAVVVAEFLVLLLVIV